MAPKQSQQKTPQPRQKSSQREGLRRLRAQQQAQQTRQEQRAQRGIPMWGRTLIAVAVVLLLILVFFRVDRIDVSGNVRYTAEEVADASGVTLGDVLMGVNKTRAASRILVKLPYITEVRVAKALPGTVRFTVVECQAAAAAESEAGVQWLMNADGKLLERLDNDAKITYPLIQGAALSAPYAGDPAAFSDPAQGQAAMETLGAVLDAGLSQSVRVIDVTDLSKITLRYDDRVEAEMGDVTDIAYKVQYLKAAMATLGPDARGTLDLSFSGGKQAVFHPLEAETG